MRLLVTSDAVGGVWEYTVELAHALARSGVEVIVACLGPPPSASPCASPMLMIFMSLQCQMRSTISQQAMP